MPISTFDGVPQLAWLRDGASGPRLVLKRGVPLRLLFMYPCSGGAFLNLTAQIDDPEHDDPDWRAEGTRAEVQAMFPEFHPQFQPLLAALPERLPRWQMRRVPVLPTWVHGRAALLGDAAHATLPTLGQGAAMAIEDAGALGELLPAGTKREDISARLAAYETLRKERAEFVGRESFEQVRVPTKFGEYYGSKDMQEFLMDYDAVLAAREYFKERFGKEDNFKDPILRLLDAKPHFTTMDNIPDLDPLNPPREIKDFLVGPKTNSLPAHGWTSTSIRFNHLDENVVKVMDKPMSSLVAVTIGRDRPVDRAMAADAVADDIVSVGLAAQEEFTVIPATPKDGDADAPILPHTTLVLCNSSQLKDKIVADPTKAVVHTRHKDESDGLTFYLLPAFPGTSWYIGTYIGLSDRLTSSEFLAAFFEKLIADRDVLKLIQEHHDRVPDAHDIPFVVRVLLEYAESQVWVPGRRNSTGQRQNAVRLYMPPPSFQNDAIKAWKALLTSPSFTFVVECRGRSTPFKPEAARTGRARPMECTECLGLDHYKDKCPIVTSPEFRAVHLSDAELDFARVGTSLGTIRERDEVDSDGFKKVTRRPFNSRFASGGPTHRAPAGRSRRQGAF
ncbi:hypothetical protein DFH09DRAFT_1371316 [Mycena vulgaris]|nr:hypothetical protein DFH09DRAFT_1371316 [Mycena vulgaris]